MAQFTMVRVRNIDIFFKN